MIVFQLFKVEIKNGATMPSQRNTKNLSFFPWFKFSRSSILASGFWLKGFGGFRKEMEKGGLCRLWDDRNCTKPSLPYQRLRLIKRILRLIPVISVGTDTCGRIFPSLQFKHFTGGLGWHSWLELKTIEKNRTVLVVVNIMMQIPWLKSFFGNVPWLINLIHIRWLEQCHPCVLNRSTHVL